MWFTRKLVRRSMPEVPLVASLWTSATCATSPLTLFSKPLLLKVSYFLLEILCCHDAARETLSLLFLLAHLAVEQHDQTCQRIRGRYSCQTNTALSDTLTCDPVMNAKNIKTFGFLLSVVIIGHMQHLLMAHAGGALGGDILHAAGTWGLGLPWGDINSTGMYSFSIVLHCFETSCMFCIWLARL